jgi:hypothetical protein
MGIRDLDLFDPGSGIGDGKNRIGINISRIRNTGTGIAF